MNLSPLHVLILGLPTTQHRALLGDLKKIAAEVRVNQRPLDGEGFKRALNTHAVNLVLVKHKPAANRNVFYRALSQHHRDCIIIELVDQTQTSSHVEMHHGLQSCRIVYDPQHPMFLFSLQFVLQYTKLKVDFRRCKSLLHLSETRASRLVNSSSIAIAYLYQGSILHANIPFLVLFKSESLSEIKRFSLLKLVEPSEREVFASYLADIRRNPRINATLTLTLKRVTGIPFNAKVTVSPIVLRQKRCYQLWVEELLQEPEPQVIPVAQSMSVWDFQEERQLGEENPFDRVLGITPPDDKKEDRIQVMLDGLQHDRSVTLRLRQLHAPDRGDLNQTWIDLDVPPQEFKKVNLLLAKLPEVSASPMIFEHFWDRLLFRLLSEALLTQERSGQVYLVNLSHGIISDAKMILQINKLMSTLQARGIQLMLVIDAQVPMNRIPQTQKVAELLRGSGCHIALKHFSIDTTPLFLYRRIQPETIILDPQWLQALKARPDGKAFLGKLIQQVEQRQVSVMIPNPVQKSQNKLFVLSGASIGQESPTQNCV